MTSELSKRWNKEERELEKGVVIIASKNWFTSLKEKIKKFLKRK